MGSRLPSLFGFLMLALSVSHAASNLPSEVYWNTKLPNVSMPKPVQLLLQPGYKGKAVRDGVHPFPNAFFIFWTVGGVDEVDDPSYSDFFFLENQLQTGTKRNIYLTQNMTAGNFLSRQQADAIPFSSDKIPQILEKLSVKPQSTEAKTVKETIKRCEMPSEEGEDKICATSLESMVDFSISKLGDHVRPLSSIVDVEETAGQQYTIGPGVKRVGGENLVVCHLQPYVYPVYSCHSIKSTKGFEVPLVSSTGSKATAVAVCHEDTSKFNPEHLAFKLLKVNPGEVPLCHFLVEGDIVWAPENM